MKYKIYNQDVIEWAKEYKKGKFHALISDAPYHLTSIVKRFGKKDSAPAQFGTDGVFSRSSKGFMGQEWDGGDVAFRPETWEAICEHLYPGAFGMVFSASRNWHRLAVAIEDAGMTIHPTIFFLWVQGQGFPKATNISKQIENGKKIGTAKHPTSKDRTGNKSPFQGETHLSSNYDLVEFESDMGKAWQGHRYGLQALKPAVEPIIVFQKPYEGRPLDNIVETGAGAINIDGGRIPLNGDSYTINTFDDGAKPWGDGAGHKFTSTKVGRPLRIKLGGESNGIYGDGLNNSKAVGFTSEGRWPANFILSEGTWDADESRFFYNVQEQIDESDPIYYCSKVSPKERNAGLEERCMHPTLKPISLAKYLATLLLPPEGYAPRRILVPFSGVGSEMVGAIHAGWEHVVGIEFMQEYVELAEKRIEYWKDRK